MTPNAEVLNSWKEVAAYLGRGVRTVQRWEQELGLPVRRPRGKSRSAVIAFKPELDKWLHQAPAEQLQHDHPDDVISEVPQLKFSKFERQTRLHESTTLLINQTHVLLSRSTDLCEQLSSLRQRVKLTVKLTTVNVRRNANLRGVVISSPQERIFKPLKTKIAHRHQAIAS